VEENCLTKGLSGVDMLLTNCTWDKFGDRLANAGGRQMGLFDELTAFFSSMSMYSSQRLQLSDTSQYQDFLKLHTGKSKSRETSKFLQVDSVFNKALWKNLQVHGNNQNKIFSS
jgi:hypothetical protein